MDLTSISPETWLTQGIFAVLFVWLLLDTRKEAKKREEQLTRQIDKQNESQTKIVGTLERLEKNIERLGVDR